MTDFVLLIGKWYRLNARELPWRQTKNAYFIWLSEVILQQTRVDQGTSYYQKFINQYPTIEDLANAEEEQVLKLWQGLGYYSRARNLHKTAKYVVNQHAGKFPNSYSELLQLPGVGPYTAAAIASFSFDLKHAVVDGNVYRILSRYFGIDTPIDSTQGKKAFQILADELISSENPAEYNQAIMEFGGIACPPRNPNCEICILFDTCLSGKSGLHKVLPVKSNKVKIRNRFFHYFHIQTGNQVALTKRSDKDVWQELYEFPMIETVTNTITQEEISKFGWTFTQIEKVSSEKHILSHQKIDATFYLVSNVNKEEQKQFQFITKQKALELPIHRLMERYIEQFGY